MTTLQELLKQWEARSKDALPTDAMLINKHIRELRSALAQQGEQQPVAWYEYNQDLDAWFLAYGHNPKAKTRPLVFGDTAAPAPQAKNDRYTIAGSVWFRKSTDEWVLELSGSINDTSFVARHTQPAEILPENVPSLPTLYAPAPQAPFNEPDAAMWLTKNKLAQHDLLSAPQPNIQNQIVKDISRKPCHACAHYEQGKRTGVSIHDETCYGCSEYYANKWEAKSE